MLNSRVPYDKTRLRSGFGNDHENQQEALRKMELLIQNIYFVNRKSKLPFQWGILAGIKSLRCLLKELQSEGLNYILTSRLNQGCIV